MIPSRPQSLNVLATSDTVLCTISDDAFCFQREMENSEFNKSASGVTTNIQKIVQNVSSMQRMLTHVDTQGDAVRSVLFSYNLTTLTMFL